jgi:putative nucleotidyltransferase with HDIG domain
VLSRLLRFAVFAVPIALSFAVALALSAVLPRVTNVGTAILWIAVIGVVSLVTLVLLERAARRLLPLAALLDLSLLFPDRAPRRFAIARLSGRQHDLHRSLREAQATGHLDEAVHMRTVIELVLALSVHDKATRGHSERVRVLTDMLAEEMKVPAEGRARLRWAAMLHDIGKLEVPTTTLNKKGKPNDDEWIALHRHPEEGAHLVSSLMPWLAEWGTAVEQHHERYDGTGYPHGLRGGEISLGARIVSLADTYEVMTAPRSYKAPMSVPAARRELIRVASTQLDPTAVRAFLNISVGRLWRAVGFGAWVAQFPLVARLASSFGRLGTPSVAGATAATVLVVGGFTGAAPSRAFANATPASGLPSSIAPGTPDTPSDGNGDGGGIFLHQQHAAAVAAATPQQAAAGGPSVDAPTLATQSAPSDATSQEATAPPPAPAPSHQAVPPVAPPAKAPATTKTAPTPEVRTSSGGDTDETTDGICGSSSGANQDCDDGENEGGDD